MVDIWFDWPSYDAHITFFYRYVKLPKAAIGF
jgi:hypothetical protein